MTYTMGGGKQQERPEQQVDEDVLAEGEPDSTDESAGRGEDDTDVMGSGEAPGRDSPTGEH